MEELRGVELLMVYALGFGIVLAAIAVWILAWRWMWKQRGIGLAQGWFTVVDQRARGEPAPPSVRWEVMRGGERSTVPVDGTLPASTPAPEPPKRAPAGPPRYLVPTEKE
jgi:hypothetical protein